MSRFIHIFKNKIHYKQNDIHTNYQSRQNVIIWPTNTNYPDELSISKNALYIWKTNERPLKILCLIFSTKVSKIPILPFKHFDKSSPTLSRVHVLFIIKIIHNRTKKIQPKEGTDKSIRNKETDTFQNSVTDNFQKQCKVTI